MSLIAHRTMRYASWPKWDLSRLTRSASLRQRQSDRPVGGLAELRGVRGELDGELFVRYRAHGSVEVLTDDDPCHPGPHRPSDARAQIGAPPCHAAGRQVET
jgi:hypothetical protein